MRSIRLSLVVYLVVLLGLAVGAVSGLVYYMTHQTLQATQTATKELLEDQYEERCREEKRQLDIQHGLYQLLYDKDCLDVYDQLKESMLTQANTLASIVQDQWKRTRLQSLYALGLLTASLNPSGYALTPVWLEEITPFRYLGSRVSRLMASEITVDEVHLPRMGLNHETEYIQVVGEWSQTGPGGPPPPKWRSKAMEDHAFPPIPPVAFLDPKFDEIEMPAGHAVQRLTLRAPVSRYLFPGFRPPPRGKPGDPPPPPPVPESPSILIQCAVEVSGRDGELARLRQRLEDRQASIERQSSASLDELRRGHDNKLQELEAQSTASLAELRQRLIAIGLFTFLAAVIGSFFLVRLGLMPLERLSKAVSKVSEKDFQLHMDDAPLPNELTPIVVGLRQALDQLQRAFAREKQAAADISHELRTPLTALMTTIQVALKKTRTPEEYRELLQECLGSGQQMTQLVERLLTLARLDAAVVSLRQVEVDAALLAEQCADVVRPLAQARELSLRVHCPGPVSFKADPDKLREVFTNLLHNAIQYNRPNGSVDLTVQRENGCLRVEVRDTGIGIAPGDKEHIFERFYRADPSRNSDGLHAGLGLAIVKGYVDLMGGSIAVDSQPGEGSTFRLILPA